MRLDYNTHIALSLGAANVFSVFHFPPPYDGNFVVETLNVLGTGCLRFHRLLSVNDSSYPRHQGTALSATLRLTDRGGTRTHRSRLRLPTRFHWHDSDYATALSDRLYDRSVKF